MTFLIKYDINITLYNFTPWSDTALAVGRVPDGSSRKHKAGFLLRAATLDRGHRELRLLRMSPLNTAGSGGLTGWIATLLAVTLGGVRHLARRTGGSLFLLDNINSS